MGKRKHNDTECETGCRETGPLILAGGNVKWHNHSGKQCSDFCTTKHATTMYPAITLTGVLSQRKENEFSHKNLYTNVHYSFLDNS